ncbi:hypothetical protein J0910_06260 [Nocardiopsis sp. CNT-189]|uniref:hypothetical protein n=1 Tax=Nocardiopsis oceanisediminis TaxID=2816862 RepID=UPI003B339BF9
MRGSRGVPALLAALLLAGGCGWPGGDAADGEDGPPFPASGLSPEEPLLCEGGERGGEDCTAGGELRWSVPLDDDGAEYFLDLDQPRDDGDPLFTTRSRVRAPAVNYAPWKEADGTLFYAEDDRVRAVDLETGRQLWAVLLRGDRVADARGLFWQEGALHVEFGYGPLPWESGEREMVELAPDTGEVVERGPLKLKTGWGRHEEVVGVIGSTVVAYGQNGEAGAYVDGERKWGADLDGFSEGGERHSVDRVLLQDGEVYLVCSVWRNTGGTGEEKWEEERTEVHPVDLETGEAGEALPPDSAVAEQVLAEDDQSGGADVYPADQYGLDEGLQFMAVPGYAWKRQALAYNAFGISRIGAFGGPGDGVEVAIGCAPDGVRPQPVEIEDALRCTNPRLFALNR